MRQLITRLDDDLHARLKDRAAVEGRSVNALVVEIIEGALAHEDSRRRLKRHLVAEGLAVVPAPPARPPSRDAAIRSTAGAGRVVSEALGAERRHR